MPPLTASHKFIHVKWINTKEYFRTDLVIPYVFNIFTSFYITSWQVQSNFLQKLTSRRFWQLRSWSRKGTEVCAPGFRPRPRAFYEFSHRLNFGYLEQQLQRDLAGLPKAQPSGGFSSLQITKTPEVHRA